MSKKTIVEKCLNLDINELLKNGLLHKSLGECRWSRGGEETATANYTLRDIGFEEGRSVYILTLHLMRKGQKTSVRQDVALVATQLHFGGQRFWSRCHRCERKMGKLYVPPREDYFPCRKCSGLTYASSQECHSFDWFFAQMGIPPWVGRRLFKRS